MAFAIVRCGSKQYQVETGSVIAVERLARTAGQSYVFDDVLMVADGGRIETGAPIVEGAQVQGQIIGDTRGPKITIYKKRQRNTYRRKIGHRQIRTMVRVTDIQLPDPRPTPLDEPQSPAL